MFANYQERLNIKIETVSKYLIKDWKCSFTLEFLYFVIRTLMMYKNVSERKHFNVNSAHLYLSSFQNGVPYLQLVYIKYVSRFICCEWMNMKNFFQARRLFYPLPESYFSVELPRKYILTIICLIIDKKINDV